MSDVTGKSIQIFDLEIIHAFESDEIQGNLKILQSRPEYDPTCDPKNENFATNLETKEEEWKKHQKSME